jgi:hypothetical protein
MEAFVEEQQTVLFQEDIQLLRQLLNRQLYAGTFSQEMLQPVDLTFNIELNQSLHVFIETQY